MKRKLTALVCCLAMTLGTLAVTSQPAAAHHELSCTTQPEYVPVQVGTRTEEYIRTIVGPLGYPHIRIETREVPVYELRKQMVSSCTTVQHPDAPPPASPNWFERAVDWVERQYCRATDIEGAPTTMTQDVAC